MVVREADIARLRVDPAFEAAVGPGGVALLAGNGRTADAAITAIDSGACRTLLCTANVLRRAGIRLGRISHVVMTDHIESAKYWVQRARAAVPGHDSPIEVVRVCPARYLMQTRLAQLDGSVAPPRMVV